MYDFLVIGAGPTGLACAIEAQRAGFRAVCVDKGCLCNSLFHYPSNMTFFTTPELLEIGDIPFPSPNQKPTRDEALEYYRKVAEHYAVNILQYRNVAGVEGGDGDFRIKIADRFDRMAEFRARKLIIATGYYDLPNPPDIPGEDLPKVHHYYDSPPPYFDADVVVIGGKNSAAIAALDLWRHGARVTLVHRGPGIHRHVKYWIKPDIENRIQNGEIQAHFNSEVTHIDLDSITIATSKTELIIPNNFVFALTGYHPDFAFLRGLGIRVEPRAKAAPHDICPVCDPSTLESNVPGI